MFKNYSIRRILCCLLGVTILSFGIAVTKGGLLDMDTYTGMNTAVSDYFHFSLGNYQLVLNIILLTTMLVFGRHLLGLGTIFNMVLVGYEVEFFLKLFDGSIVSPNVDKLFILKIVFLIIGAIILCLGASLYITADLGVAPYDALAIMLEEHFEHLSFRVARMMTDFICVILGVIFGTVLGGVAFGTIVGNGTILTAFGTGPFIDFFNKTISVKLVGGKTEEIKN